MLFSNLDGSLPADEAERTEHLLKAEPALAELFIKICRNETIMKEWSATVSEPSQPLSMAAGPTYGTHEFTRTGAWSYGGQFAQGFGIIDDNYKPALLWTYQNFVEPYEHKLTPKEAWVNEKDWLAADERTFDALTSPWRSVMTFVNWPIALEAENPAGTLLKAIEDRVHGYYCFRNRCKNADDIVVTALLGCAERRLQAEFRHHCRLGPWQALRVR